MCVGWVAHSSGLCLHLPACCVLFGVIAVSTLHIRVLRMHDSALLMVSARLSVGGINCVRRGCRRVYLGF